MFKYSASVSQFLVLFIIKKKINYDICWIPIVHEENTVFTVCSWLLFSFSFCLLWPILNNQKYSCIMTLIKSFSVMPEPLRPCRCSSAPIASPLRALIKVRKQDSSAWLMELTLLFIMELLERRESRDDRGERHSGPVGMVQPLNIHAVSH